MYINALAAVSICSNHYAVIALYIYILTRGIKLTAQSADDDPRLTRQHRGIRLKTFHRLVGPNPPRDTRV